MSVAIFNLLMHVAVVDDDDVVAGDVVLLWWNLLLYMALSVAYLPLYSTEVDTLDDTALYYVLNPSSILAVSHMVCTFLLVQAITVIPTGSSLAACCTSEKHEQHAADMCSSSPQYIPLQYGFTDDTKIVHETKLSDRLRRSDKCSVRLDPQLLLDCLCAANTNHGTKQDVNIKDTEHRRWLERASGRGQALAEQYGDKEFPKKLFETDLNRDCFPRLRWGHYTALWNYCVENKKSYSFFNLQLWHQGIVNHSSDENAKETVEESVIEEFKTASRSFKHEENSILKLGSEGSYIQKLFVQNRGPCWHICEKNEDGSFSDLCMLWDMGDCWTVSFTGCHRIQDYLNAAEVRCVASCVASLTRLPHIHKHFKRNENPTEQRSCCGCCGSFTVRVWLL